MSIVSYSSLGHCSVESSRCPIQPKWMCLSDTKNKPTRWGLGVRAMNMNEVTGNGSRECSTSVTATPTERIWRQARVDRCNQIISPIERQLYSWHWTKVDVQIKMSFSPNPQCRVQLWPYTHPTIVKWWKVNLNYRKGPKQRPFPQVGQVNFPGPNLIISLSKNQSLNLE